MHPDNLTAMDDTRSEEQRQEDIWREQERQVRETAKAVQFGCSTVARALFNETVDDTDWKAGYAAACYEISELLMKQDVVRWAERAIERPLPPPENPVPAHVCDGSGCCKEAEPATPAVCHVCKGSRVAHEWGFDDPQPCKFCAEKPATPAAGEDEALLREADGCAPVNDEAMDLIRRLASRLRALLADVARERDWRVQAEAERDMVLLRDDDALAEARATLAAEKIRADDLAAWVDHYRTKEASALARAEAAESATKAAVKKEREICAVMCERHGFSSAAALIRARAAGEGGENVRKD